MASPRGSSISLPIWDGSIQRHFGSAMHFWALSFQLRWKSWGILLFKTALAWQKLRSNQYGVRAYWWTINHSLTALPCIPWNWGPYHPSMALAAFVATILTRRQWSFSPDGHSQQTMHYNCLELSALQHCYLLLLWEEALLWVEKGEIVQWPMPYCCLTLFDRSVKPVAL